jgi:hypothetical protein
LKSKILRCAASLCCLLLTNAAATNLSQLEANKILLTQLLSKVETGADPCFSNECQEQKRKRLIEIFRGSENLPGVDQLFLKNRRSGIRSALHLVDEPFRTSDDQLFPRNAEAWASYWKKRSSHDLQLKSTWMNFLAEIYALNDGLQLYTKISDDKKDLIQQAWDKGAAKISELMIRAAVAASEASYLDAEQRSEDARLFRQKAIDWSAERATLEENFRGQFRAVMESLFPATSFKDIVAFFATIHSFSQLHASNQIFESEFSEPLFAHARDIKNLTRAAQNFTDLEYGVVGLKNFYSPVNPLVTVESEIPVQEFLDQVEARAQMLLELGTSYFLLKAGGLFFDSKWLANSALPTLYSLWSIEKGFSVSTFFLAPSQRTAQLQSSLPPLSEQMERRNVELFKIRKLLVEKISQTDEQIKIVKQSEGASHEKSN